VSEGIGVVRRRC